MSHPRFSRLLLMACAVCGILLLGATPAVAQQDDQPYDSSQAGTDADQAPGRVARLAYLSGQVQFAPAGENDWGSVEINRPMVIGDRVLTGDDGRAVLELGDASVRIDHDSAFDFLNLAEDSVQIELSQGTLNLAVRQLADGENFEVDTPTIAFVASTPGVYRIDDAPDGAGSMVTVFQGSGTVYGENGASREVVAGTSYRFNDSTLADVEVNDLPQPDDFDRFCETRDANYTRYAEQQQQYVPSDMIGSEDLYRYGQWDDVPEYGHVWYPTAVPAGWAPYRYGHWAWIDPWGWTWVDNQPWGFAPFHYGRWVHVRSRWCWVPGPVRVRPVYAPALVAFIGGSGLSLSVRIGGGPVGWFPLGPRDVYVPWFHASRRYFTRVNVTNIRNVYVNRTVINNIYDDYHHNRYTRIHRYNRYANRNSPGAVTVVPRKVFADARPVHDAALRIDRRQLARAKPAFVPDVLPGTSSLGLRRATRRPAVLNGREPFARPVVARHTPPPPPVQFAAREKIIASQHGRPLTPAQMHTLGKQRFTIAPRDARVRLVAPMRTQVVQHQAEPISKRVVSARPVFGKDTLHPIPARDTPLRSARRAGELPSARFAHPAQPHVLPRVPVIRSVNEPRATSTPSGRLPVVKPLESVPQSFGNHAEQQAEARQRLQAHQRLRQIREQPRQPEQQHTAQLQTERNAREQQARQQRTVQLQTQQRALEQTTRQQTQPLQQHLGEERTQQRRNIQVQAEQRSREQQVQQQRRLVTQSEQRVREQGLQQQMRMQQAQHAAQPRAIPRPQEHYTPHPANRGDSGHTGKGKPFKPHPDDGSGH